MKTKYHIYKLLILFAGLFLILPSCKKELAKININPNAAEKAQPDYLLTGAIKTATDQYWSIVQVSNPTALFVQHWAMIQYTDPDRYIFTNNAFEDTWKIWYHSIADLDDLAALGKEEENNNYTGVALTLRSWVFTLLTDNFGDIPYSQAINIDENVAPVYDTQKDVYTGVLADLKEAQSLLDVNGKPIEGDIIYGNNIEYWKRFVNSLRLRVALRIADAAPDEAKSTIDELKTEGAEYIASNSQIAQLTYSGSPNQNPVERYYETREDHRVSKTIVDALIHLNDPRLPIYVDTTEDPTAPDYVGLPNGLLVGDASNYGLARTSRPGIYFRENNSPAVIISYAEVLFDRAEVAARHLSDEDAADLYQQAVAASLGQYGISSSEISDYLAQSDVQYDPGNYKKSIGEQKWLALFGQGPEAFAEWRRLDYPQLAPAVAGVLSGQIPARLVYPGIEQSLNGANYKKAITNQGDDVLTTKLWFDVF